MPTCRNRVCAATDRADTWGDAAASRSVMTITEWCPCNIEHRPSAGPRACGSSSALAQRRGRAASPLLGILGLAELAPDCRAVAASFLNTLGDQLDRDPACARRWVGSPVVVSRAAAREVCGVPLRNRWAGTVDGKAQAGTLRPSYPSLPIRSGPGDRAAVKKVAVLRLSA